MGTPKRRRLPIGFTATQQAAIAERAGRTGLTLSATVRALVSTALAFDTEPGPRSDSPAALAALVAAEHAVLMVAAVLPEGQRRLRELAPRAAVAAEDRLRLVQESGHE